MEKMANRLSDEDIRLVESVAEAHLKSGEVSSLPPSSLLSQPLPSSVGLTSTEISQAPDSLASFYPRRRAPSGIPAVFGNKCIPSDCNEPTGTFSSLKLSNSSEVVNEMEAPFSVLHHCEDENNVSALPSPVSPLPSYHTSIAGSIQSALVVSNLVNHTVLVCDGSQSFYSTSSSPLASTVFSDPSSMAISSSSEEEELRTDQLATVERMEAATESIPIFNFYPQRESSIRNRSAEPPEPARPIPLFHYYAYG